jgi:hypothetical protein
VLTEQSERSGSRIELQPPTPEAVYEVPLPKVIENIVVDIGDILVESGWSEAAEEGMHTQQDRPENFYSYWEDITPEGDIYASLSVQSCGTHITFSYRPDGMTFTLNDGSRRRIADLDYTQGVNGATFTDDELTGENPRMERALGREAIDRMGGLIEDIQDALPTPAEIR